MPSRAGPTHPVVSVPSFMIASRLLVPLRVGVATLRGARGVGLPWQMPQMRALRSATKFALTSASIGDWGGKSFHLAYYYCRIARRKVEVALQ